MTSRASLIFLFDFDNTLIDHDHIQKDFRRHLEVEFGKSQGGRFWKIFEKLEVELGYANYLGALNGPAPWQMVPRSCSSCLPTWSTIPMRSGSIREPQKHWLP